MRLLAMSLTLSTHGKGSTNIMPPKKTPILLSVSLYSPIVFNHRARPAYPTIANRAREKGNLDERVDGSSLVMY